MALAEDFPIQRVIMEADDLGRELALLAATLHRDFPNDPDLVLLGIKTRGVYLSRRLAELMLKNHGQPVMTGEIDITLYRDDLSTLGPQPVVGRTTIDFDVTDKKIVLIDDVIFTGRTIRAVINELYDFGRPASVTLAVLVDRGGRELPIAAAVSAARVALPRGQRLSLARDDGGRFSFEIEERS